MTQEQGNAVDNAQAALDAQQNNPTPTPAAQVPTATTADIERIVGNAARVSQGQIDKGLTALRRDFTQQLETQKSDAAIEGLPEDVKSYMAPLITRMRGLEQQLTTNASTPQIDTAQAAPDTDLDTFLQGLGLDRNAAGLNLAAYNSGDMTTFLASARSAIQGAHNEAPQNPAAAPASASPPVDGAPTGGSGPSNIWDNYDLYNSGQISQEDFNQRMAAASPDELNG